MVIGSLVFIIAKLRRKPVRTWSRCFCESSDWASSSHIMREAAAFAWVEAWYEVFSIISHVDLRILVCRAWYIRKPVFRESLWTHWIEHHCARALEFRYYLLSLFINRRHDIVGAWSWNLLGIKIFYASGLGSETERNFTQRWLIFVCTRTWIFFIKTAQDSGARHAFSTDTEWEASVLFPELLKFAYNLVLTRSWGLLWLLCEVVFCSISDSSRSWIFDWR